jgi:hypothetical protein
LKNPTGYYPLPGGIDPAHPFLAKVNVQSGKIVRETWRDVLIYQNNIWQDMHPVVS